MKSPSAAGVGILILDDDPDVVDYLADVLGDTGYDCMKAGAAAEALELLRACAADRRPKVAIVDLILAEGHGMQAADALVAAHPPLKILMISGYADNIVTQTLANGAKPGFLTKVFTAVQLRQAVADLLAA